MTPARKPLEPAGNIDSRRNERELKISLLGVTLGFVYSSREVGRTLGFLSQGDKILYQLFYAYSFNSFSFLLFKCVYASARAFILYFGSKINA